MKPLIHLASATLRFTGTELRNPHRVTIPEGITAVIGPNGAGKSTLGNIIERGWNFLTNDIRGAEGVKPRIRKIEFSDIHSLAGMKVEYYQQRYEATMNDEVLTVAEILGDRLLTDRWAKFSSLFGIDGCESKKINFLSSGELRKLLIANALIDDVDLLILDNPYIGLDETSRRTLDDAIDSLHAAGVSVMMLVSHPDDIHRNTAFILPMRNMEIMKPLAESKPLEFTRNALVELFDFAVDMNSIPTPPRADCDPLESVLEIEDCSVDYGERRVIDSVSWRVTDGENWALAGPNGSGKSTLLSLVCADNPRAYSSKISLFGRRRGTGETIWDIKRRISFISPELTLHFHPSGTVRTIVAGGLNDTSGLFIKPTPQQLALADTWLRLLHLDHLAGHAFATLSSGERQMVMLARTFIKQPRLMILDEPFHALDYARNKAVRAVINHFAARSAANPTRWPMAIILVSHYAADIPECISFTKTLPSPRQ